MLTIAISLYGKTNCFDILSQTLNILLSYVASTYRVNNGVLALHHSDVRVKAERVKALAVLTNTICLSVLLLSTILTNVFYNAGVNAVCTIFCEIVKFIEWGIFNLT